VVAWGETNYNQTNVPSDLTNAIAIAAAQNHSLALRANGTVEAWGDTNYGLTNIPAGLTNVVAIAAGGQHNLALEADGCVVAWGLDSSNQTNVPASLNSMSNVMAIAAGSAHSVALQNDGTVVVWGDNSSGQTNVPQSDPAYPVPFKFIAAGGNHSMAAIFSPMVQYPIDVSKDLLLIFNTNSTDSSNVCYYYLTNRPMVSNANVLGIGGITNETTYPTNFTNDIEVPIQNWLAMNPTKRPAYVILFQDIPSRANITDVGNTNSDGVAYFEGPNTGNPSVQYQLNQWCATNWHPFVTSINMNGTGGTNDCIAYINKLASMGSNNPPGQLMLSGRAGGYANTNYYFDDTRYGYPALPLPGADAESGVWSVNPAASVTYLDITNDIGLVDHITNGFNVAGYLCWGAHSSLGMYYAISNYVNWTGNSGWWIIRTVESFNGQRNSAFTEQGNFLMWFSSGAFGTLNYANTPVAAVCYTDEPGEYGTVDGTYFGLWESGKSFAICA
jgi:hypothetical protein